METWKKESHYDSNGTGYNIDMNREPQDSFLLHMNKRRVILHSHRGVESVLENEQKCYYFIYNN